MKEYQLGERIVYMFGDYVGVCWNTDTIESEKVVQGRRVKIETTVKEGSPYIDFVVVSKDDDGEPYECDDNSVEGGLGLIQAKEVLSELSQAIEYMERL
jgi:hypothetical protein